MAQLDPHLAIAQPGSDLLWYDALALPTTGRGWSRPHLAAPYDRLPATAEAIVRPEVWSLSRHSAGIEVRFTTDATEIAARWTVTNPSLAMDHMPATGVSGVDLYVRNPEGWRWLGIGRPTASPTNQACLVAGIPARGMREYRLYLPLYNSICELWLGVPSAAVLGPAALASAKPVVVYGTSIVHGGCAARPGMAYPAILGRQLDLPMINLGFSGNGRAEPEVAQLVASLDAAAFVIDPLPNLQPAQVSERMPVFLATLRAQHPTRPIIVVENITYQQRDTLHPGRGGCVDKNVALRAVVGPLMANDAHLYLVPGRSLLGDDGEGTVDGTHPTDLGFMRIAAAIGPVLAGALASASAS